ncbi:MAG: hypothetical protein H7Y08_06880 [Rhizobiaceae bacterium]|nr:hypothetical protein [Rhizobiaceae bacterium]
MSDTDPEMMREQQAKDLRHPIDVEAGKASGERTDSDAASRSARQSARTARDAVVGHAEDAVFAENQRSDYSAEAEVFEDGRTDAHPQIVRPPLAKKDRSLLGD